MDKLIDSHCHLDFNDFDGDRLALWSRCRSSGVVAAVIPGVIPLETERQNHLYHLLNSSPGAPESIGEAGFRSSTNQRNLSSELHALGLFFTVGLHPWWIEKYSVSLSGNGVAGSKVRLSNMLAQLESRLNKHVDMERKTIVGLGESGLDFSIDTSKNVQLESLRIHLALSCEQNLPVILHSVNAHADLIKTIKEFPGCYGVIHAFSGSYQIAAQYWQLGFALGVGGIITYERAKKTRDAIKRMPLESLVLETDAPDMPVSGRQGSRNSPEYLPEIAQHLARLRGCSFKEIAEQTTSNSLKLFSIDSPLGY